MAVSDIVVDLLGGHELLGRVAQASDLRELLRQGLPYASLEHLTETLHIPKQELDTALKVPARTLARRKKQRRLRSDESDQLYRLAHVAALAMETFGDRDRAVRWLHRPNRALHGETPLALLDTEIGMRQVEAVLGRIAHGVIT